MWQATASPGVAAGVTAAERPRAADAEAQVMRHDGRRSGTLPRAQSTPPLTSGAVGPGAGADETGAGGSLQGEADPLVSNGLGSPLCRGALGAEELSQATRRDCETSGFVAAGAPTGNYGIDVHIDTGFLGLSSGGLLSTVQDLFVTPLWMALVWAVHALVVMLEWCFTIDLLDSTSASVGRGLRQTQATFTEPWLASVLAVAGVLAIYNGLVRRRVSETLGQALLAGLMMVAGLWVMLDPAGTVGALGGWANQASLGTLAVSARGSPTSAGRALADSMAGVFASAIEVPWCYLEFGDVAWCRNPARLDSRLHAAGLTIASRELTRVGCTRDAGLLSACAPSGSDQARALEHSAQLLRSARSNGAIFLALPANGPERNSINDEASLLRVMCQSSQATHCRGPMAAQAEFRTNGGTWKRLGGLLLIVAGVLGMLLLFGFIALRLLGAAIFSLLYLLLAPAAVLAPALGESGRMVFRRWAIQLLGALVAKLLFAFLLGAILAVLAVLAGLEVLGWWTQWLLMSAFWWGAFGRRHQALSLAGGVPGNERGSAPRSLAKRVGDVLGPPRKAIDAVSAMRQRLAKPPPTPARQAQLAWVGRERARGEMDAQVMRLLEQERRDASTRAELAPEIQELLSAKRTQLSRVHRGRATARARGDRRRAAALGARANRIEGEIAREQERLNAARSVLGPRSGMGGAYVRDQAEQRGRFLDAQAELGGSSRAGGRRPGERRDYAALAGLAGYGRAEYEGLDPRRQRAARLEVDRELALRRKLWAAGQDVAASTTTPRLGQRERRTLDRAFDAALERRMREGGHGTPAPREEPWLEAWRRKRRPERVPQGESESSVMRDAREVARRRKRQLGRDRP